MINVEKIRDINIISFNVSKINSLITEDIREKVYGIFNNQNTKNIIDLGGVSYIDSSGFGLMLSLLRTARNNFGILKLANPESSVKKMLETLQLVTVFEIYDKVDECIRSF